MKQNFYEYFEKCLIEDKLPHAFLIETDNIEKKFNNLIEYLYNKKMIQTKDYVNNLNLFVVEPDGKDIKSESINNLQKQFMTMPSNTKYNIYIIKYAEKMNISSANKILKFLEEPESKILGILLASNSQVLTTIKSRCQIFKMYDLDLNNNYDEESNLLIELLNNLNITNEIKLKQIFSKIERIDLINIIASSIKKYNNILNENTNSNKIYFYARAIIILDKILRMLKSNVNIDLVLDKLCIEVKD